MHDIFNTTINKNNLIYNLSPVTKLLLAVFLLTIILSINYYIEFVFIFFIIFIFILFSQISVIYVVKNILSFIPFLVFILLFTLFLEGTPFIKFYIFSISYEGIDKFFKLLLKSLLCIIVMLLLNKTTNFIKLVQSLKALYVPTEIILIFFLMYRYINLFINQFTKMLDAIKIRSINLSNLEFIKSFGNTIGILFIKTYERAYSINNAMQLRGFDINKITDDKPKIPIYDFFYFVIFIFLLSTFKILLYIWIL